MSEITTDMVQEALLKLIKGGVLTVAKPKRAKRSKKPIPSVEECKRRILAHNNRKFQ